MLRLHTQLQELRKWDTKRESSTQPSRIFLRLGHSSPTGVLRRPAPALRGLKPAGKCEWACGRGGVGGEVSNGDNNDERPTVRQKRFSSVNGKHRSPFVRSFVRSFVPSFLCFVALFDVKQFFRFSVCGLHFSSQCSLLVAVDGVSVFCAFCFLSSSALVHSSDNTTTTPTTTTCAAVRCIPDAGMQRFAG